MMISCESGKDESQKWSDTEKEQFIDNCINGFNKDLTEEMDQDVDQELYCKCLFEKVSTKHSPDEVGSLKMQDIFEMANECIEEEDLAK